MDYQIMNRRDYNVFLTLLAPDGHAQEWSQSQSSSLDWGRDELWGTLKLACVASVPVRKKSSQTIFRKQAARKLGREIEQSLDPTFAWPVCGKSFGRSSFEQERLLRRLPSNKLSSH